MFPLLTFNHSITSNLILGIAKGTPPLSRMPFTKVMRS